MVIETNGFDNGHLAETCSGEEQQRRVRSTIQFPYCDLDSAIEVAKTIHERTGNRCTVDQLSVWMGHDSVNSGTFRMKLAAARTFGIVETSREDVSLTSLGNRLVDPQQERTAKADAFLNVPLYRAIFDQFKGLRLPPDPGLERAMVQRGVTEKQKGRARQAFKKSAEQAGFYNDNRDRLVMPGGLTIAQEKEREVEPSRSESKAPRPKSVYDGQNTNLDPFILGLLQELPNRGSYWPVEKRKKWLQTAESIFGLIYEDEED